MRSNCNAVRVDLKESLLLDLDGVGVGFGKSGLGYGSATDVLLQPLASHLSFKGAYNFSPLLSSILFSLQFLWGRDGFLECFYFLLLPFFFF